jgi:hypothetical protein
LAAKAELGHDSQLLDRRLRLREVINTLSSHNLQGVSHRANQADAGEDLTGERKNGASNTSLLNLPIHVWARETEEQETETQESARLFGAICMFCTLR